MNSKGGPLWKNCFLEAKETHPDIFRGSHRNPYQLENAIKTSGTVFCISLGLNSLPGNCDSVLGYIFKVSLQFTITHFSTLFSLDDKEEDAIFRKKGINNSSLKKGMYYNYKLFTDHA